MTDETDIQGYLAKGGKLSAPDNAPPRYRAELLRMMASFVDSELAGAAGFADLINEGPGIKEKIAASRIVMEKIDHAERVLNIMGAFGVNTSRYMNVHPWAARVGRDEELGAERRDGDMRLNVFHYPLSGWTDAVVMNVLMGRATVIQLTELSHCSYQPLGEAFGDILPRERRHAELGEEGVVKIISANPNEKANVIASADYWRPRVADTFGGEQSSRFDLLRSFGLRHQNNEDLRLKWAGEVDAFFAKL
ncbi:phenylacetate-CoA oxygenase subunit PaaI [Hyphococcus flavus]|uniref:Phenylacetate-CoA oxygenase subunit PaaI n=1 Tax=Hyphococcus flavus TaxID=1866326 RepID=A0AAF0CFA9_9PROT|nr:Phenylacetic acid catabolic protein [Hyphococcus flavus]WDI30688.1 phenylacetate-CoA oxygenase subunit PaaI [Hyphococcus flavus]